MRRILSVLISLCMLFSCAAFAETAAPEAPAAEAPALELPPLEAPAAEEAVPEAPAEVVPDFGPYDGSVAISDLSILIEGESYALNPGLSMGAALDADSLLLDFFVEHEGESLLPVQVKLDGDGVSVLLGDSDTAYVASAALLEEPMSYINLPTDALNAWLVSYMNLIDAVSDIDAEAASAMEPIDEAELLSVIGVAVADENVTAGINGVEQEAIHRTYTLTGRQIYALLDEIYAVAAPEVQAALGEYMRATFALAGEEGVAINGFTDLYDFAFSDGFISMEVDETINADYAGFGKITVSVDPGDGSAPFVLPLSFNAEDADTFTISFDETIDDGYTAVDVNGVCEVDGLSSSFTVNASDDYTSVSFSAVQTVTDAGSAMEMDVSFDSFGTVVRFALDGEYDAEGAGYTDVQVNAMDLYGASFRLTNSGESIEDRIAAASEQVLLPSLEEESWELFRLMASAAALAGDVEKLMGDESVKAFADMLIEMFSYDDSYDDYSYYGADDNVYDDYGYGQSDYDEMYQRLYDELYNDLYWSLYGDVFESVYSDIYGQYEADDEYVYEDYSYDEPAGYDDSIYDEPADGSESYAAAPAEEEALEDVITEEELAAMLEAMFG